MSFEVHQVMNNLSSLDSSTMMPEDLDSATYLSHMLKTRENGDVTFLLETPDGEKRVNAHKLVLIMKSSYFYEKLSDNQGDKGKIIRLENVDPKAFEKMIRYCYDCIPVLESIDESCSLFKVANEFKVRSLMIFCQIHLNSISIELGNVFSLLYASENVQDKRLGENCNKFLEGNTREMLTQYDLYQLAPAMMHTILDLPKLSLNSEHELLEFLIDWAKIKFQADSGCGCAREYLEQFLKKINFLALTFEEFAMLCKDNPDFFNCDEIACISLNIALSGSRGMPDWYDKDFRFRTYIGLKESKVDGSQKSDIEEPKISKIEECKESIAGQIEEPLLKKQKIMEGHFFEIEKKISQMEKLSSQMEKKIGQIEEKFYKIEARVSQSYERFHQIEKKIGQIEEKCYKIEAHVSQSDERFHHIEKKVGQIEEKCYKIEARVSQSDEKFHQMEKFLKNHENSHPVVLQLPSSHASVLKPDQQMKNKEHPWLSLSLEDQISLEQEWSEKPSYY